MYAPYGEALFWTLGFVLGHDFTTEVWESFFLCWVSFVLSVRCQVTMTPNPPPPFSPSFGGHVNRQVASAWGRAYTLYAQLLREGSEKIPRAEFSVRRLS